VAGNWIPDLIFSEETFNPLLPSADEEPLGSFLVEWKLEDEDRLLRLMNRVVRRCFIVCHVITNGAHTWLHRAGL
jgi:hypothetical protein